MDPKQKKMALIVGGIVVLLLFLYLRSKGGGQQSQQAPYSLPIAQTGSSSVDFSPLATPFQAVIDALNQSQTGLAAIAQNQQVGLVGNFQALGAASWLSCLPAGGGRPDAACIKAKGNVVPAGLQNVSGVKTQEILNPQYTSPYSACKMTDGSYNLACVGNLIAGSPSVNTVNLTKALTRQPTMAPRS